MNNDFGDALREARKAAGMTLAEAAARTGLSAPYLSELEKGTRGPLSAALTKVAAEALGANLDFLLAARARTRGFAELPTRGGGQALDELAIHLMICWPDLTEEQVARIADVLHGGER